MKKHLKNIFIVVLIFLTIPANILADRVGEGAFWGGMTGAAIGGAAGGRDAAFFGGVLGAGAGAAMGAAAERRNDYYYDGGDYDYQTVYYVQPTQKINRLNAQKRQTQRQLQRELAKENPSQRKINALNNNIQNLNAQILHAKNTRVRVIRDY